MAVTAPRSRPDRPIRVAIVDDDPLVRSALSAILHSTPDIVVVAEAGDGAQVDSIADAHQLDVVLMDIRMPRVDGVRATERLRSRPRPPEVIVLTVVHADDVVLRALRAGASGFLLKDTPPDAIIAAVRRVAAGEAVLSPAATRQLIDHVTDADAHAKEELARRRLDALTPRERAVADAVSHGMSNVEIASKLLMSVPTVKTHISRLLAKLHLTSRTQVALLVRDAATDDAPDSPASGASAHSEGDLRKLR